MKRKILALAMTISILLSFAVIPAHAARFSSDNYTQYERGLYTIGGNFSFAADTTNSYITYVKATANGTTTLTKDRSPIGYKNADSDSDDAAKYAHIRVYFAAYAYSGKTALKTIQIRMDKDGTGSSRNAFILNGTDRKAYPEYTGGNAWLDRKDKQGAWTLDSNNFPQSGDFHKIDIISDLGAWKVGTNYLFIDGNFVGMYYDTGLTSNHFHGVVFRVLTNGTIKSGECYMAAKFDSDRIGHREYYDSEDYTVTFEDVMQDAGLGIETSDKTVIFKTDNVVNYAPGADDCALYYNDSTSERTAINENVTRSGSKLLADCTYESTASNDYQTAIQLLGGLVPKRSSNGIGIGYVSSHTRFKYLKVSFDQTISDSGMWIEYSTYYSGKVQAMQMWNNDGYLVAAVKGSGTNITCNGKGTKPLAETTGTNHIDWIIEPSETDSTVYHYLYINNKFVASGNSGNQYATRIADLLIGTNHKEGVLEIDNWLLTLYNDTAEFEDMGVEPPQGYEPKYDNLKVLFTEDFEGETADSLASTYPRTTRISDGTCLSYWGTWGRAIAPGYNSSTGIFTCAGVASDKSRTFEAYIPADSRPHRGLANIKFNLKPQASLSRQDVIIFRTDSYASADSGKNGALLFGNDDLSVYVGKWLTVNIWIDLDNDTYEYNICNAERGNVVRQGSGTQKFNDVGGFVIKLKGSDSSKDFSAVAPIIDNIYFASATIPDDDAFDLKSFSFSGATASVNFDVGENVSEDADVYAALYSSDNKTLKSLAKKSVTFDKKIKTASGSVDGLSSGDSYRLFVWYKDSREPICHAIDSKIKVYPNAISNNFDFHTSTMRAFLADSNSNCKNYADGTIAAEEPLPVTFSWAGEEGYSYRLKVSENSDLSSPWVFSTTNCYYDVYNLKIGTRYYWTVSAIKDSKVEYTTDVQTFTTINATPRNLLIGGSVRNARDIGGWSTTTGKKVKQGLVFRSSALDTWDNDMDRANLCVSPGGIDTMKNMLGIKTEIDFRQGHSDEENFPDGKTTSILGSGVKYYHCPMIADNFLTSSTNKTAIKTIFGIFADASNYPITYHCAVGADRTGFITYLLNGLLGVSQENLTRDYLLTNFSYQGKYRAPITDSYVETLNNYTGSTLQEKIYNYLRNEIGIPKAQLDFVINYLTE